ncbi:helix-turn-helix domain-containing protein [Mycolicibacterium brumae]|uniref:GntR C-terminal domain-containing protein n=1 Tax=Mycolicibacterium brumae TaxID=85968 RepID=A0A2G5PGM2_9MYCO|nr:helix-turn-helix domain-containing protein [Mycolicibacterium brumae]MCV7192550.1 helix-turn-helix domain-containing protein [Mycolicibacterium brumae]PIB77455.1 hypothetical protein CQY22_000320 [Mycolicibacterium brumae]RWA18457.1 hypothetical protein MBRU_04370 [Mycolicibacterium brumae DSM 44177]UWW10320.1 helix-turn-helix domain-containing protein [Mycolicibacterium brumae]
MTLPAISLDPAERDALSRLMTSRRTPRDEITRARIVLACAEDSVAEAARRCGVSFHTAAKWKRRYQQDGVAALRDLPRTGRPAVDDNVVTQTLTAALREPPPGGWTTRSIAEVTGISQSTVCRIRREHFPPVRSDQSPRTAEQRVLLAYVYADAQRCALAFHSPPTAPTARARSRSTAREIAGALETVLCAPLVAPAGDAAATAMDVLRRAVRGTPPNRSVTVVMDVEVDSDMANWLRRNPRVMVRTVPRQRWLGQLHALSGGLDGRQIPELAELGNRVRKWAAAPVGAFEWSRFDGSSDSRSAPGPVLSRGPAERRVSDSTLVMRGLYQAILDGALHAGRQIRERSIGQLTQLSTGVVTDALRQLAEDGLVHSDEFGRYFVPAPQQRDVLETYTARALLGSALVRRLASAPKPPPAGAQELLAQLVAYAGQQDYSLCGSLDLDFQDELAHAADMPRIEAMFVRLTLQLRLFVTLLGLNYQYPPDEIVADDTAILEAILGRDPDGAVAAWRAKIDNCVRYMVEYLQTRSS